MRKLILKEQMTVEININKLNDPSYYPSQVCRDCLEKAGGYLIASTFVTTRTACQCCGKEEMCHDPKDFGYPVFSPPVYKGSLMIGPMCRAK